MNLSKFVSALLLAFSVLALSANILPMPQLKASPSLETIFEDDFDDQTINKAPVSADWIVQKGGLNLADDYAVISNNVSASGANSLLLNDSNTNYGLNWKPFFPLMNWSSGYIQFWFRQPVLDDFVDIEFYYRDTGYYDQNTIFTYIRLNSSVSKIQYYNGDSFINVTSFSIDNWYNVTLSLTSGDTYGFYVNGTKHVDATIWNKKSFDTMNVKIGNVLYPLDVVGGETTQTIYLDDVKLYGENVGFASPEYSSYDYGQIYYCDYNPKGRNNVWQVWHQYFYAEIGSQNTSEPCQRGGLMSFSLRNKWGAYVNLVANGFGLLWSEWYYPNDTQSGLGHLGNLQMSVVLSASQVSFNMSGSDSYINAWNYILIEKDLPLIFFKAHRDYKTSGIAKQSQIDYLFKPVNIEKIFWTNSSGFNSFSEQDTKYSPFEPSASQNYFGYAGYYFRQNMSVGSIFTYNFDNSGLISGLQLQINPSASYNEYEYTFKQAYGTGKPHSAGNIEEIAGVILAKAGDETSTFSIRTESQTLFSDWSDYRASLGKLLDSTFSLYLTSTVLMKNFSYSSNKLSLTINGSSSLTTVTKVYCGSLGEPIAAVHGADSWSYDSTTRTCTISVTHSSSQEIILDWSQSKASGLYDVQVYVQKDGVGLAGVTVDITGIGGTMLSGDIDSKTTDSSGKVSWQLPYGVYAVRATYGEDVKSMTVWLNSDRDTGFDFTKQGSKRFGVELLIVPVFILILGLLILPKIMRRR